MPIYTYRREDGTTFDIRQKFSDDPLTTDPATGQRVHRVPQASGIVFKGSGFYVTDSKAKNGVATPPSSNGNGSSNGAEKNGAETKADTASTSADDSGKSKKSPSAAAS